MGADFIFVMAKTCDKPDEAKERINQLSENTLAEVAEQAWGNVPDDWQQVRDLLREGIDIASDPHGRTLGTVHISEPGTYVITGGMTWGDDPSEAFAPLWALELSGLEYD